MVKYIISILIGYAFGLFQTGFIYGKTQGIDIRTVGSGNVGTTNALRTLGKKAGLIVMIGDIAKCMLSILVTWLIFGRLNPSEDYLIRMVTGLGCIIGHNYPFYMNFKGGKGVACTAGLIMSISLILTLIGYPLFFITLAVTHYASLASLFVGAMFMIGVVVLGQLGHFHMSGGHLTAMYIITAIITAEMYYRHRENIRRLLNHTERKTYIFKKNRN